MNALDLQATPRLASKAMLRHDTVRDADLLLLPERVVRLNESSAAILRLCDGARTVGAMVTQLQVDFGAVDLTGDVVGFLSDAHTRGWVVLT